MAASVSGSRSRHGSRTVRTSRPKSSVRQRTASSKAPDEASAPKQPDLNELRRRRLLYLSVSPEARRRLSASAAVRTKSKDDSLEELDRSSGDHARRKRKHRSSSSKAEKSKSSRRSSSGDYVYAQASSSTLDRRESDGEKHRSGSEHRSKHSSSSRRHSLPTVVETEVTPDDSVSQIGVRRDRQFSKTSSSSRSSLRRSSTTPVKLPPISEATGEPKSPTSSPRRSSKRDSTPSLLGSLLRRNTAPAAPTAPRLIECLTCAADDVPHAKSAKLACGHRMCHTCLKRVFKMSVTDPAHMPPKCCTNDHIPLEHVDKLFDLKFKMHWNTKYQEFKTKNRIYCPSPKCGVWIKPTHIHSHQGREYGQCPRCQMKVCTSCNGKMHKSRDCPKDPEIAKLVEQAKEKGWQSCHNCHAMVELKEGCNHMTCRCLAEFCMVCGAKWKTCDCPWFNYRSLPDGDRLNDWRVPEPIQNIYRRAFGAADAAANPPPAGPPQAANQNDDRTENRRQRTYLEELEHRRRQEREDAALARRMQLATLLDPQEEPHNRQRAEVEAWGLGNAAGHFLNDNFVQNAAQVVMSAFGDATMGRRGERSSGRRSRARQAEQNDPGLVPNFLGDESVVGAGQSTPRARPPS